jgi:hypothetical protein
MIELSFFEILCWGPYAKDYLRCWIIPLRSFKYYVVGFWRINIYLLRLRLYEKNVTLRLCWITLTFIMKFLCWESGVLHI